MPDTAAHASFPEDRQRGEWLVKNVWRYGAMVAEARARFSALWHSVKCNAAITLSTRMAIWNFRDDVFKKSEGRACFI
jgi:hypothetical protein